MIASTHTGQHGNVSLSRARHLTGGGRFAFVRGMSRSAVVEFTRTDGFVVAAEPIRARQTVLPKRAGRSRPGPGAVLAMFDAVAVAPDHRQRLPFRFVLLPDGQRGALGAVLAQALAERAAEATPSSASRRARKHCAGRACWRWWWTLRAAPPMSTCTSG